jgi:Putative MetA-pathway of phenol degradation
MLYGATNASAVPPLVIGDVPTADSGTVELYAGVNRVRDVGVEWAVPATELVVGISSWQELTVEVPYLVVNGGRGLGDLVLGTKLQLLPEAAGRPGLAGSVEWKLANGDQAAGVGSGSFELGFLARAQKTWGWATLIGNAGYTIVGVPKVAGVPVPARNTGFLGLGLEAALRDGLSLVADLYWRSADAPGAPARAAGDVGFTCGVAGHLALQGAIGTSLRADGLGGPRLRVYLGLKTDFSVF